MTVLDDLLRPALAARAATATIDPARLGRGRRAAEEGGHGPVRRGAPARAAAGAGGRGGGRRPARRPVAPGACVTTTSARAATACGPRRRSPRRRRRCRARRIRARARCRARRCRRRRQAACAPSTCATPPIRARSARARLRLPGRDGHASGRALRLLRLAGRRPGNGVDAGGGGVPRRDRRRRARRRWPASRCGQNTPTVSTTSSCRAGRGRRAPGGSSATVTSSGAEPVGWYVADAGRTRGVTSPWPRTGSRTTTRRRCRWSAASSWCGGRRSQMGGGEAYGQGYEVDVTYRWDGVGPAVGRGVRAPRCIPDDDLRPGTLAYHAIRRAGVRSMTLPLAGGAAGVRGRVHRRRGPSRGDAGGRQCARCPTPAARESTDRCGSTTCCTRRSPAGAARTRVVVVRCEQQPGEGRRPAGAGPPGGGPPGGRSTGSCRRRSSSRCRPSTWRPPGRCGSRGPASGPARRRSPSPTAGTGVTWCPGDRRAPGTAGTLPGVEVLRDPVDCPTQATGTVVTIGAYDGVHRGHATVIGQVRRLAAERGMATAVVTFDRHPASVVRPESAPLLLTDLDQKLELLAGTGVDYTRVIHFDEARSKEPAEEFVREDLVGCLGARVVVIGEDFHFGHGRAGNVTLLRRLGDELGFEVAPVELVGADGQPSIDAATRVSSTRIRTLLQAGELAVANSLLGRHHEVRGRVGDGDKRARDLGFPTANLEVPDEICLPRDGIYAGWYVRPSGERQAVRHQPGAPADVLRRPAVLAARSPPPGLRRRPLRRARPRAVRRPPARRGALRRGGRRWSSRWAGTAIRPAVCSVGWRLSDDRGPAGPTGASGPSAVGGRRADPRRRLLRPRGPGGAGRRRPARLLAGLLRGPGGAAGAGRPRGGHGGDVRLPAGDGGPGRARRVVPLPAGGHPARPRRRCRRRPGARSARA